MAEQSGSVRGDPPASQAVIPYIARVLWREILSDHLLMVAAGLGFYAVFGLLPALAAAAAVWGQFAGFASLSHSVGNGDGVLPQDLVDLLRQFVSNVPEGFGGGLAPALNLGLVLATSYRAAGGLLTALNIVYDVPETRGRLRRGAVALAIGTCGIVMLFVALALMALPLLLAPHVGSARAFWLLRLRWPVLALVLTSGESVLFRYAPSRDLVRWRSIIAAAATTTMLWLAASFGVSLYAAHVASFGRFYGSLASVTVVLLWFYASALAVLAGAEIDGVLTTRTERRPPKPAKVGPAPPRTCPARKITQPTSSVRRQALPVGARNLQRSGRRSASRLALQCCCTTSAARR